MSRFIVWLGEDRHTADVIEADDAVDAAVDMVCDIWLHYDKERTLWVCRTENIVTKAFRVVKVNVNNVNNESVTDVTGTTL